MTMTAREAALKCAEICQSLRLSWREEGKSHYDRDWPNSGKSLYDNAAGASACADELLAFADTLRDEPEPVASEAEGMVLLPVRKEQLQNVLLAIAHLPNATPKGKP